ncbi:MAG: glycosyltransferase [Thermodesulfobacteriota bacterium]
MRLLFATGYGHLPDVVGGLQTTLHELCLALIEHGIEPTVLCGYAATINKESARPRSDEILGYRVIRMVDPVESLAAVAAADEPDGIVVLTSDKTIPMIVAAMDTGIGVGVYIHNVEFREYGGILLPDPDICYFANSQFTADRLRSLFGLESTVLLPLVQPENYRFEPLRETVLYINPTLLKGVETFFSVARLLPDLPFRVFESWNLTPAWRNYCLKRAAELPNVEWCHPTRNLETLYGSARLLIMPSVWEEAYGRSAAEAQVSGIPVIASRRGGLVEAVGEGGLIIDADSDPSVWAESIHRLYHDESLYRELSAKAQANAAREEADGDFIVNTLLTTLTDHLASCSR